VLAAACAGEAPTEGPRGPGSPGFQITDGAHGAGNPHFFFLPPIADPPAFSGQFDATQSPAVKICEWAGTACGVEIAAFSMTAGRGSEIVRIDPVGEIYIVNWMTQDDNLDPAKPYRLRVLANGFELGHADVDVVTSTQEAKGVDTEQYVPLVAGRPLVIKFRIEEGALPAGPSPLSAGFNHACGIAAGGAAYCWGRNNFGQLGNATTSPLPTAAPVAVTGGHTFVSVTAGVWHSCGLKSTGQAYCWGWDGTGQIGRGSPPPFVFAFSSPIAVVGGHTFTALSAGGHHTCGLTTTGQAFCWGWNIYGQIGLATPGVVVGTPQPVSGGHTFVSLAAGLFHTCGVTTGGETYCWGSNQQGALGVGSFVSPVSTSTPQLVTGGHTFAAVTAGVHTCGLTAAGEAYCWGYDNYGQLGAGGGFGSASPVRGASGLTFAWLVAGGNHTCGLSAGTLYCWGYNFFGQIGDGSPPASAFIPYAVPGGPYAAVNAGHQNTCAVTFAGEARCWGANDYGQVGTGAASPVVVSNPVTVTGGLTFPVTLP